MFIKRSVSCFYFLAFAAHAQSRPDVITVSNAPLPAPGFTHLPYANPNSPKGGHFTTSALGSFDNLNPFILRGTAPDDIFLVWQPLFKPSDTDSVTAYADLAQSAEISADGLSVTFHLDPRARFSDGTPVTAADVVWTYHTMTTKGAPIYAALYAGVATAAMRDPETAVFTLRKGAGHAQILNLAEMYVLPEHFWRNKDFSNPLNEFPVGSGPYQVASVAYGRRITLSHVKNWWAAANAADRGFYNFDRVSEQFFDNDEAARQAFLAGEIDARIENSPALWDSGYAARGGVARVQPALSLPSGVHGLVMNTRRALFMDPKIRRALTLAFDFNWVNRVIYHSERSRAPSYFANTGMAASGLPSPAEQALLAPFRTQIAAALFTAPFQFSVAQDGGDDLSELRQAFTLLTHAGYHLRNFRLVDKTGHPFSFEILLPGPGDEPAAIAYAAALKQIGVTAVIRIIDPAAYQRRLQNYDFDMTNISVPTTAYPDAEQAGYWGCAASRTPGGYNLAGICSPAIDAMIAAEIAAPDLTAKMTALHALDRLLLNGWFIIPWGSANHENLAYWRDKFDMPAAPLQRGVDYDLWWAK